MILMNASIADEKNLTITTSKGYHYVCVSSHCLKDYTKYLNPVIQKTDRNKHKVELSVFKPEGKQTLRCLPAGDDRFSHYCRFDFLCSRTSCWT